MQFHTIPWAFMPYPRRSSHVVTPQPYVYFHTIPWAFMPYPRRSSNVVTPQPDAVSYHTLGVHAVPYPGRLCRTHGVLLTSRRHNPMQFHTIPWAFMPYPRRSSHVVTPQPDAVSYHTLGVHAVPTAFFSYRDATTRCSFIPYPGRSCRTHGVLLTS
ncbi:Hypothetical predicted protein [Octopus vulgaris]|uniref:Uncharacterized protein n=1 Tax=Octopus vulgaris TaxID=6645 RepID=A0AA36FIY6_OCTVU|nr:Hypothetical predicted protein [Octopus vulgaris]